MSESKIRTEQTDLLMKAVLELDSEEMAYRFFEDLCTIAELRSMAQRLEVAIALRRKRCVKRNGGRRTSESDFGFVRLR